MASARIGLDGQGIGLRKATLTGGAFPTFDPDALDWFARVATAGGEITPTNKTAFNTAFLALKSNDIWNRIKSGCFFVGIDGGNPLAGAFTPFKHPSGVTNPLNTNFTTSDYDRLTGIVQNGGEQPVGSGNYITGTKAINTRIANRLAGDIDNPNFPLNDRHFLVFNNRNDLSTGMDVGSLFVASAGGLPFRFTMNAPTASNWTIQNCNQFPDTSRPINSLTINNGSRGFYGINYFPGRYFFEGQQLLCNGEVPVEDPVAGASTSTVSIPSLNSGKKRIACYSIGLAFPDNGQEMVTTYQSIINTLLSSLV
jgi:hypothetical protein